MRVYECLHVYTVYDMFIFLCVINISESLNVLCIPLHLLYMRTHGSSSTCGTERGGKEKVKLVCVELERKGKPASALSH